MQLKTLRNVTAFDQSVVFKGQQLTMEAGAEETFPADVAELFLQGCEGLVQEVVLDDVEEQFDVAKPMWIANVTGAPWLKEMRVSDQYYDRSTKRNVVTEHEMENIKPITIKRSYNPGMQEYRGQDGGLLALNLFPKTFVIPPYRRLQVPEDIGRWMLKRDGSQARTMRGSLIKSRKPSAFEPDESWELDDIRSYLKFVSNGKEKIGQSEGQIVAMCQGNKSNPEKRVREAKRELLKTLFYYLVSPKCRLPTRREFEEYRKGSTLTEDEQFALTDFAEWEKQDESVEASA